MKIHLKTEEEIKKEEQFNTKVYSNKAIQLLYYCFGIYFFNFCTYLIAYMLGDFDFGIFIELFSFAFLLITYFSINKVKLQNAKKCLIISIIPIILLFIYDNITNPELFYKIFVLSTSGFVSPSYQILTMTLQLVLISIKFAVYRSISKAMNEDTYKEPTDWFYDKKD